MKLLMKLRKLLEIKRYFRHFDSLLHIIVLLFLYLWASDVMVDKITIAALTYRLSTR